mgnify:CR=1 FL=1
MESNFKNQTVTQILKKYISSLIPKKQTNIFFMLFNGIDEAFNYIDFKINSFKREGNFLTAQDITSLRSLASQNGFEPKLKVPSKGIVKLTISSKLFNRVGLPVYLPPYSVFVNKTNGLEYYYESDKMLRIDTNEITIPIVEGVIRNTQFLSTNNNPNNIERFYLKSKSIAENSINIIVNNIEYLRVKSFMDNDGVNDNKQFMLKYSNDSMNPMILYIKGSKENDIINCNYKDCSGEYGNLLYKTIFDTNEFLDSKNNTISVSDDEIAIVNISGFNFGSDGSDANVLRSAIGFNHGVNLLFDKKSYENYIDKYSNILLQKIILSDEYKAIKNIYLSKKIFLNPELLIEEEYSKVINFRKYLFTQNELTEFTNLLEENEYALSSHNIFDTEILKYSIQFKIKLSDLSLSLINHHKFNINKLIYFEFSKFLYNKFHQINIELLLNEYMTKHNINLEYTIFNSNGDIIYGENTTIQHKDKLPILKGDFIIKDTDNNSIQLFNDINWVIE